MMRWLALACLCAATSAAAQDAEIRSGDHPTFVRLVLPVPAGADWTLGRIPEGYGLRVEGAGALELGAVFNRIGRNRISSLSQRPGGIDIALACDCHADAFLWRDDRLVVDIVDGPAPEGDAYSAPLEPMTPSAPSPPTLPPRSLAQAPLLPLLGPGQIPRGLDPAIFAPSAGDALRNVAAPPATEALSEAEIKLAESLAEAAGAGILTLAPQPEVQAGAARPDPAPPLVPSRPGLAAHTSIARRASGASETAAAFCPSPEAFNVADWAGSGDDFWARLVPMRDGLITDGGAISQTGVLALARFYLAWGFGIEAQTTLALAPEPVAEAEAYRALAALLDDRPAGASYPPTSSGCPGEAQLWTMLIRDTAQDRAPTDLESAVKAWSELPDALRGLMGPRFARLLLAAGATNHADAVLGDVARGDVRDLPGEVTATAELQLQTEGTDAAVETLRAATRSGETLTTEAVVQLIELSLRGDLVVAPETIELAEAMGQEFRGSAQGGALSRAEIRALAAAEKFARAFGRLQERRADVDLLGADALSELTSELLTGLSERAPNAVFLDHAYRDLPEPSSLVARDAVAARLRALGFSDRADQILAGADAAEPTEAAPSVEVETPVEAPAAATEPVMLAEPRAVPAAPTPVAGMASIEPLVAEPAPIAATPAALPVPLVPAAVTEPAAATTPALEAADIGAAAPDLAATQAWSAGDWASLQNGSDPLLSEAAAAVLAPTVAAPAAPPLAARRDLLRQSDETRALVGALLDRFPAPQDATTEQAAAD